MAVCGGVTIFSIGMYDPVANKPEHRYQLHKWICHFVQILVNKIKALWQSKFSSYDVFVNFTKMTLENLKHLRDDQLQDLERIPLENFNPQTEAAQHLIRIVTHLSRQYAPIPNAKNAVPTTLEKVLEALSVSQLVFFFNRLNCNALIKEIVVHQHKINTYPTHEFINQATPANLIKMFHLATYGNAGLPAQHEADVKEREVKELNAQTDPENHLKERVITKIEQFIDGVQHSLIHEKTARIAVLKQSILGEDGESLNKLCDLLETPGLQKIGMEIIKDLVTNLQEPEFVNSLNKDELLKLFKAVLSCKERDDDPSLDKGAYEQFKEVLFARIVQVRNENDTKETFKFINDAATIIGLPTSRSSYNLCMEFLTRYPSNELRFLIAP